MSRLPPLIALSYFEVTCRTKSFAKAAIELNVTPAAISHQIKALEDYLNVELFVRHHRRISLTPAAKAALPELHEGFTKLQSAVEKIRHHSDESRAITVCAEPLFATKWIVPRLHRFYARCPEAEVSLQASLHTVDQAPNSGFGASNLKRADIDVSVRLGYGDYMEVEPQQLMRLDLVPMCQPGLVNNTDSHHWVAKQPLLWDSTLSRFKDPCGWLQWCHQYAPESAANYKELRFGNGLLALEAALSGQGILLGCKDLLTSELTSGKIEVLSRHAIQCATAYYVVSAGSGNERPIAKQFRQWLIEESQGRA